MTNGRIFFESVISWWEVHFDLYFFISGRCLWPPHEDLRDFNVVTIRRNSDYFAFFRESFSSWRYLALEFDFRVIISCQYFPPKAELAKARLHSTKTIVWVYTHDWSNHDVTNNWRKLFKGRFRSQVKTSHFLLSDSHALFTPWGFNNA